MRDVEPYVVTSAAPPRSAVLARRRRRYVAVQTTRVVAFVAAIVLPLPIPVRAALILLSGALSLYAVTAANAPPAADEQGSPRPVAGHVRMPGRALPS